MGQFSVGFFLLKLTFLATFHLIHVDGSNGCIEPSCSQLTPSQLECISMEMSRLKSKRSIILQSMFGVHGNIYNRILCVGLYVLVVSMVLWGSNRFLHHNIFLGQSLHGSIFTLTVLSIAPVLFQQVDLVPPDVVVAWKHYFLSEFPHLHVVCFTSHPDPETSLNEQQKVSLKFQRRRKVLTAVGPFQLFQVISSLYSGKGTSSAAGLVITWPEALSFAVLCV